MARVLLVSNKLKWTSNQARLRCDKDPRGAMSRFKSPDVSCQKMPDESLKMLQEAQSFKAEHPHLSSSSGHGKSMSAQRRCCRTSAGEVGGGQE